MVFSGIFLGLQIYRTTGQKGAWMSRNGNDKIFVSLFVGLRSVFHVALKRGTPTPKSQHKLVNIRLKLPFCRL